MATMDMGFSEGKKTEKVVILVELGDNNEEELAAFTMLIMEF